jgi:hypothetical protein
MYVHIRIYLYIAYAVRAVYTHTETLTVSGRDRVSEHVSIRDTEYLHT